MPARCGVRRAWKHCVVSMETDRFLLMMLAHDDGPHGPRLWAAATLGGVGRALTREQAEALAQSVPFSPRFLLHYTEDSARFAQESAAPTLALMPGESIWSYGEPTRADMLMMLRAAFGEWPGDSAPSPDPDNVPTFVAAVVGPRISRSAPEANTASRPRSTHS
jgi:hypothetical protein